MATKQKGKDVVFSTRLDKDVVELLDCYAYSKGVSKKKALGTIITKYLDGRGLGEADREILEQLRGIYAADKPERAAPREKDERERDYMEEVDGRERYELDRKMVELPKDAEGRDIPLDTRVLYSEDGVLRNVRCFCYHVGCTGGSKWIVAFENGIESLTSKMHITPPDSLERVAADIESAKGWCDQNGDYDTGCVSISKSKLIGWSDRIRKLAKKTGGDAHGN